MKFLLNLKSIPPVKPILYSIAFLQLEVRHDVLDTDCESCAKHAKDDIPICFERSCHRHKSKYVMILYIRTVTFLFR